MATHSCTLAWKIPWVEEPGRLQSMGSLSRTRLSDFTFTFHFHALEKEMTTHSSVLAWRIPGTGEPGGLPSMGSHRVRHDGGDLAAAAAAKRQSFFFLFVFLFFFPPDARGLHFMKQQLLWKYIYLIIKIERKFSFIQTFWVLDGFIFLGHNQWSIDALC